MTVLIKDMKQGEYYLHKKSGIVLFILSNTIANASTATKAQRVITYSFFSKNKWQPDQHETHPETQDMEVEYIASALLGSVPRHIKDTSLILKKKSSSVGADKDLAKFFKGVRKEVPAAAPKHPKRAAISENKNAMQCVKCSKPTKELSLFNSVTRWCPECE